jgi:hypothetical protein
VELEDLKIKTRLTNEKFAHATYLRKGVKIVRFQEPL